MFILVMQMSSIFKLKNLIYSINKLKKKKSYDDINLCRKDIWINTLSKPGIENPWLKNEFLT